METRASDTIPQRKSIAVEVAQGAMLSLFLSPFLIPCAIYLSSRSKLPFTVSVIVSAGDMHLFATCS